MARNSNAIRTIEFSIPIELMFEFSKVVVDNGFGNWIEEVEEENEEIIMIIQYEERQWRVIDKSYKMIENFEYEDEYEDKDEDEN